MAFTPGSSSSTAMWVAALLLLALLAVAPAADGLAPNYYGRKCRYAEAIVRKSITSSFQKDRTIAAGLVRIHFHDAFVEGADASLLLTGAGTEQTSPANQLLHGFEAIDAAKAAVEKVCPGVVSCADILTFATRDLIWLSKGPFIRVKGGRLDGKISQASRIGTQLPPPILGVSGLTDAFTAKGLSQKDMVVLSGAHTIGKARCITFQNRLFPADPNLNSALAAELRQQCPQGQNQNNRVDMDSFTPNRFDNLYYTGLTRGLGVFNSDDVLFRDPATSGLVKFYATRRGGRVWSHTDFPASFVRLSEIGVKTGSDGEIRKVCTSVN